MGNNTGPKIDQKAANKLRGKRRIAADSGEPGESFILVTYSLQPRLLHGGDGLALGVLGVCDRVSNDVLEEDLFFRKFETRRFDSDLQLS